MTGLLPDGLDPALLAQDRDEVIAGLRAYVRQLSAERSRATAALRVLTQGVSQPPVRPRRPNGTYPMVRAYLAHLRAEGYAGVITSGPAAEWMLARGWVTTAPSPQKAAAQALWLLARRGELESVRHGRYHDPLAMEGHGDG